MGKKRNSCVIYSNASQSKPSTLRFSNCLAQAANPSVISPLSVEAKSVLHQPKAPMPLRVKQAASAFLFIFHILKT